MHLAERREQEPDDTFLLLVNASHERITFRLPDDDASARWEVVGDTAADMDQEAPEVFDAGGDTEIEGRSLRLLVLRGQNGT